MAMQSESRPLWRGRWNCDKFHFIGPKRSPQFRIYDLNDAVRALATRYDGPDINVGIDNKLIKLIIRKPRYVRLVRHFLSIIRTFSFDRRF